MIGIQPRKLGLGIWPSPWNGRRAGGAGGGFVGPFDGMTVPKHAYALNRLFASYSGPLVRLRRVSDNAEADYSALSSGELDSAAINTWTGGEAHIVTMYDQAGSVNMSAPGAANQPFWSDNVGQFLLNGHPSGYWSNGYDSVLNPSATIPVDTLETMGVTLAFPTGSGRILSIRNALTGVDDYNSLQRMVFLGETYPGTRKLGSYYNSANLAISPVVDLDNNAFVWRNGKVTSGISHNKDGDGQVYQARDLSALVTPAYLTWGNSRPGVGAGTEGYNPLLFAWYTTLPITADFTMLRDWSRVRFGTP